MGIPAFYSWLLRTFSNLEKQSGTLTCENVYIDMNSVIHPACHETPGSEERSEEDMFRAVMEGVERIIAVTKPTKMIYLAVDGVAPGAKMRQQRSRRLKSIRDMRERIAAEDELRNEKLTHLEPVMEQRMYDASSWDSNVITPGTDFMIRLSSYVENCISQKLDGEWKDLQVVFSNANVPGEGEHKVLEFIRHHSESVESALQNGVSTTHNEVPNSTTSTTSVQTQSSFRHCIVGEDADLIMLGLALHKDGVAIVRNMGRQDALVARNRRKGKRSPIEYEAELGEKVGASDSQTFRYISIDLLRNQLGNLLRTKKDLSPDDFENAIDDLVLLFFFGGNDFLPHLPTFDIRNGILTSVLSCYVENILVTGRFLVDRETKRINMDVMSTVLLAVVKAEEMDKVVLPQWLVGAASHSVVSSQVKPFKWHPPKGMTQCQSFERYHNCRLGNRCDRLHGAVVPLERTIHIILSKIASFVLTHSEKNIPPELKAKLPKFAGPFGRGNFSFQHGLQIGRLVGAEEADFELRRIGTIEEPHVLALANAFNLTVKTNNSGITLSLPIFATEEEKIEWALRNRRVLKVLYKEQLMDYLSMREDSQVSQARETDKMVFSLGSQKIKPWMYYLEKFEIDPREKLGRDQVQEIVQEYFRGMQWNIRYYLHGLPSWDWHYPFHYAPFAHDLFFYARSLKPVDYDSWESTEPPTPIQQLMAVLPASSKHALPASCASLLGVENSPLSEFYPDPDEIELDPNGRRFKYQWIPLLPTGVDLSTLIRVVDQTKKEWTKQELDRDSTKKPKFYSNNPVFTTLSNVHHHDSTVALPLTSGSVLKGGTAGNPRSSTGTTFSTAFDFIQRRQLSSFSSWRATRYFATYPSSRHVLQSFFMFVKR